MGENRKKEEREWILGDNPRVIDAFAHSLAIMVMNVQKAHRIINLTAAKSLLIMKTFEFGDISFATEAVEACRHLEI